MSDFTVYPTPAAPPLPGRGGVIIDPVFGSTIIQLSDATDSTFLVGHSYSSVFVMNYDNTYFVALYNTSAGGGVWKTTPFNSTTYAVGTSFQITAPGFLPTEHVRWDISGSRNNILYWTTTGSGTTSRRVYEWNATTHVSTVVKDFEVDLRRPGVVTAGASPTQFTAAAFVSPVNDMSPHFEISQNVKFTTGPLSGDTAKAITGFDPITKIFTTAAFSGTPNATDAFYVYPSGFNTNFVVSRDARYFIIGLSQAGGQDTGHILCVWDRNPPSGPQATYIHYFTKTQFGASNNNGWHQIQIDKAIGSNYLWSSIGNTGPEVLINFITGALIQQYASGFGHADTSSDGRIVFTAGVAPQAKMAYRSTAAPTVLVDVLTTVTKGGLTDNITGRHCSWSLDPTKTVASTYLGGLQGVVNTKWVADAPTYRMDNFTTKMTAILPLTPANMGEVWDNQDVLTYMGTTKASIVGPSQWAFDPAGPVGGTLWVRGTLDHDMTLLANSLRISTFDWRLFLDEITVVYTDELPGNTQKWVRVAKAFSRTSGIGFSETSWTPRANLSPDGRFIVFASTWGNRLPRKDIFAVDLGATSDTLAPAAPTGLTVS